MTSIAYDVVHHSLHDGVALLTIDSPPVNLLSGHVRRGLAAGLELAERDPTVRAIVVTATGRAFIAGADISEFDKPPVEPSLDELFARFAHSPKPIVAALNGLALGGGMEVALCCDYRLAGPRAAMGLPEVKLGLLPGGGGTQRLPRLIGPAEALELLLFGEPVPAAEAARLGLVDEVVDGDLVNVALAFARSLSERDIPPRKTIDDTRVRGTRGKLETLAPVYARARKAMPGRFAIEMIIQCVEAAVEVPSFEAGMDVERSCFRRCLHHPQHDALKHLFFAERECAKVPGLERSTPSHAIARAAYESDGHESQALRKRLERAGIEVAALRSGDAGLTRADLIVLDTHTSPEFVAALPKVLSDTAVLFSIASEQDLDELAELTGRPSQTLGVELSPTGQVIEFIRSEATSDVTLATAITLCKRLGVIPIVSRRGDRGQHRESLGGRLRAAFQRELNSLAQDGFAPGDVAYCLHMHGFPSHGPMLPTADTNVDRAADEIVMRCMRAWAREGAQLLREGVAARASDIDIAAVRGLGFPELSGGPMYWLSQHTSAIQPAVSSSSRILPSSSSTTRPAQ